MIERAYWPPREDLPNHPALPARPARFRHPPPEADEIQILLTYNHFHLEERRIYRFVTSVNGPAWAVGPFYYNLFNMGPGHIYYRGDQNPAADDEHSSSLPPGSADNAIFINSGLFGLRVVADREGDITIRLAQSIGTW